MGVIVNYLANAIALSAMYALVAIGFTLIFGVGNVLNFAHGGLITVGAFVAYQVSNVWGVTIWFGLLAAMVVAGILSGILYLGIVKSVEDKPVRVLLLTLLIGFIFQHGLRIVVGTGAITVPSPTPGATAIAGVQVLNYRILAFVLSWALIIGLFLFVDRTKTGKAILATSMSQKGAALVGIDSSRINAYTWTIAGGLAGLAGVLLMVFQTGSWQMGTDPMVLSFSIVILGGLGSIRGSLVGAYIIGFLETATTTFISTELTGVTGLILLVIVLLVRPSGLFGREVTN